MPYDYAHPMMHIVPHRLQPPNAVATEPQLRNEMNLVGAQLHPAPPPQVHAPQRQQEERRKSVGSSADTQQVPSLSGSPRPPAKPTTRVHGMPLPVQIKRPPDVPRIAYVNGVILAADEARVPITDFGFSSGCAIVEEVLLSNGAIVRLDAHIAKLKSSAGALGLPMPLSTLDLQEACRRIVGTNQDGARAALYIQLTFGAYGVRSRYLPPTRSVIPTLVIHSQPLQPVPPSQILRGLALFPTPDNRPMLSTTGLASAQYVSTSQLPELLALRTALANGCDEAVLFDPATDEVTGTTQGNIFCVKFDVIYTPPTFGRVPDGVIRRFVLDVCAEQEIGVREVSITMPFLSSAAEVFCTSTLDQVLPVRAVGKREIGQDGAVPGPVTSQVMAVVASGKKPLGGGDLRDRSRQPGTTLMKRTLNDNSDASIERRNKVSKSGSKRLDR
jgi:branched-subunit amino acid aminotransferase/4-amino-4-deoxychorismate lyase